MTPQESRHLIRHLADVCRMAEYVLTQLDVSKADFGGEIMPLLRDARIKAYDAARTFICPQCSQVLAHEDSPCEFCIQPTGAA